MGNREKGVLFCIVSIVRDIGVVMGFRAWHSEAALSPDFAYRMLSGKTIFA